jgi:hypothetical protein|tara:strand:- start:741 stop:977 length:237 start_codon:yes stop_codon:yes gene_type:complete
MTRLSLIDKAPTEDDGDRRLLLDILKSKPRVSSSATAPVEKLTKVSRRLGPDCVTGKDDKMCQNGGMATGTLFLYSIQ